MAKAKPQRVPRYAEGKAKSIEESVTGFDESVQSAKETILRLTDPTNELMTQLEAVLSIKSEDLYSEQSHELLTEGSLPLSEVARIQSDINFWQFFDNSGLFGELDQNREFINRDIYDVAQRLHFFVDGIIRAHYQLMADIDSGDQSLDELGIHEEQVKRQKAYQFNREIADIYDFLFYLAQRGVWPKKKPTRRKKTRTKESRDRAIESGALMALSENLLAYTHDDMVDSFTAFRIMKLSGDIDKDNDFSKETGQLIKEIDAGDLEAIRSIDTGFLMALSAGVERFYSSDDPYNSEIRLYLPDVFRKFNIDPRKYSAKREKDDDGRDVETIQEARVKAILKMTIVLDDLIGFDPNGNIYKLLSFNTYLQESDTVILNSPYLFALKRYADDRSAALNEGRKGKPVPFYHKRIHTDVVGRFSSASIELASRIISGIDKRGTRNRKSDGRIHYTPRHQTLIDDCPQISGAIQDILKNEDIPSSQKAKFINNKLRDVFTGAYKIIQDHTDVPDTYTDFKLPMVRKNGKLRYQLPTKSTLNQLLDISYTGKLRK